MSKPIGLLHAIIAKGSIDRAWPEEVVRSREDSQMITRRRALALAAFSGLAVQTGSAFAAQKLRIGKSIGSSFPFSAADLAKQKGIFDTFGIDAEISVFRGDGQMQQALAAGTLDIGLGSGPSMGYAAKGVPAIAVAALASEPRNMSLVVLKNGPIQSIDDLKGLSLIHI